MNDDRFIVERFVNNCRAVDFVASLIGVVVFCQLHSFVLSNIHWEIIPDLVDGFISEIPKCCKYMKKYVYMPT